jgi:hypothetical protein
MFNTAVTPLHTFNNKGEGKYVLSPKKFLTMLRVFKITDLTASFKYSRLRASQSVWGKTPVGRYSYR